MTYHHRIHSGLYWDQTWTLVRGCTKVSEACEHCWLAAIEYRFRGAPEVVVQALTTTRIVPTGKTGRNYTIPQFTGVIALRFDNLPFPTKLKSPQVFIIWSDLFHSGVPDYFIDEAFKIMEGCERHRFLILTKRSARMQMYVQEHFGDNMLKNVGLGVTVETQRHIVRLDDLLNTAAPMRFIHLLSACVLNFAEGPETQQRDAMEIGPSVVFRGASLWESQAAMVRARISSSDPIKRFAFRVLMPVGHQMAEVSYKKQKPGLVLRMIYWMADTTLFEPIRHSLGLQKARICYTSGTMLSADAFKFYHALNLPLKSLYGTTEGGALSGARNDDICSETVGPAHKGAELRITDD